LPPLRIGVAFAAVPRFFAGPAAFAFAFFFAIVFLYW
jgi:hypothetical protein